MGENEGKEEGVHSYDRDDELYRRERVILDLGERDEDATVAFRSYVVPDQKPIWNKRQASLPHLLDADEYAVRIQGYESFQNLEEYAADYNRKILEALGETSGSDSIVGRGYTNLDVIVGDVHHVDECYRYRLRDVFVDTRGEVTLIVFPNVVLDKLANHYAGKKKTDSSQDESQPGQQSPALSPYNWILPNIIRGFLGEKD